MNHSIKFWNNLNDETHLIYESINKNDLNDETQLVHEMINENDLNDPNY